MLPKGIKTTFSRLIAVGDSQMIRRSVDGRRVRENVAKDDLWTARQRQLFLSPRESTIRRDTANVQLEGSKIFFCCGSSWRMEMRLSVRDVVLVVGMSMK